MLLFCSPSLALSLQVRVLHMLRSDTFIAAAIHALEARRQRAPLVDGGVAGGGASCAPPLEVGRGALRFACDVAADKVGQVGFEGLGARHGSHVVRQAVNADSRHTLLPLDGK